MNGPAMAAHPAHLLFDTERVVWRIMQGTVWMAGAGILAALILRPSLGLHAFWNVLIPLMLVDLREVLAGWFPGLCLAVTTMVFMGLLVGRARVRRPWATRPLREARIPAS